MFLFDGGIPLAVSQKTESATTTESLRGTRSENHDRQSDECDEEAQDNERRNVFHARLAYIGGDRALPVLLNLLGSEFAVLVIRHR